MKKVYFVKGLSVFSCNVNGDVAEATYKGAKVSFDEENGFSSSPQLVRTRNGNIRVAVAIQEYDWSDQFELREFPAFWELEDAQEHLKSKLHLDPIEW